MENLEHQAAVFFGEKEYDKALEIYQLLFQGNPKNEGYAVSCGNCCDAKGDKEAALNYYNEALRLNRNSEAAMLNLSTIYYELNDFDRSEEYARKALNLNKDNITAWQNLANLAFCKADYEQALTYYQKMYDINPNSYLAMVNIANTYYNLGKYVSALEFAKKAITRHPSSVAAHILAGNILTAMGKYEKSIDMYTAALDLDNDNSEILCSLSEAYHASNDWENCLLYTWKYLKSVPEKTNALHLNFGYLLYECFSEKSEELAQKYAAKWLKLFSDNKIAEHMANAILKSNRLQGSDNEFIKETFDAFAPDFEKTLADLEYQAPKLVYDTLKKYLKTSLFTKCFILDLGCGTGLCGEQLKNLAVNRKLIGVDLSEKMLEIAEKKGIYNKLVNDDLCHYLENSEYFYQVIAASDVLTYFGDLTKVFVRVSRCLLPDGLFAFTFSENEENNSDFFLMPSGRFVHSPSYIERALKSSGLQIISSERHVLRNEAEIPVYGYIIIAKKPELAKQINS